MPEIIGGLLMMVGGGMLSASSLLAANRRGPVAELVAALPFTPAPADTPPDMLALLDRLS